MACQLVIIALYLMLHLCHLASKGTSTTLVKVTDSINNCMSLCPKNNGQTCEFRYAYAQYYLEINCKWTFGCSKLVAKLFNNCAHIKKIDVLILTEVDDIQMLLPLMSQCKRVRHLNLTENRLTTLPPNYIQQFEYLQELILERNELTELPSGSLSSFSLERINLRHNKISKISALVFQPGPLSLLNIIDLSHNYITTLNHWPLKLQRKNMKEKLRLILDYNKISQFSQKDEFSSQNDGVSWTPDLMEQTNLALSLAGNRIQHLSRLLNGWNMNRHVMLEFGRRRNFIITSLQQNPLACDCKDYDVYLTQYNISNIIPVPSVLPYCHQPQRLKFRSVYSSNFELTLKEKDLVCQQDCYESKCICTEEPWRKSMSVNCLGVNLGRLPHRRELPSLPDGYTFRFNFSASRLARKLPGMPSVYRDAYSLDLSGSGIESLSIKYFVKLRKLVEINLNHNLLSSLDHKIADMTFPNLHYIRLDNNPWNCSCNSTWFLKWLRRMRTYLKNANEVRCGEPSWLAGQSIPHLPEHTFCDSPRKSQMNTNYNQLALSSTAISGAILVMTLAVLAVFCARVTLFTQCGIHPFDRDECDGEQKRCDAFILFHPLDLEWVVTVLVDKLTNRVNPYVLCTHDRACIPGVFTYNSVCHAIENSKRVIVVITSNFSSSVDVGTDYQLTVNYLTRTQPKQTNRLIHIVFPEVKRLPQNLVRQKILTKKSVVHYGCRNFWKQVMYRMPVRTMTSSSFASSRDCSTSFQAPNDDQQSSLLQKSQTEFVNYPNVVYEPSTPTRQLNMTYLQPAISISSISSTNIHTPPMANMLTYPRCTRLSTFQQHSNNNNNNHNHNNRHVMSAYHHHHNEATL